MATPHLAIAALLLALLLAGVPARADVFVVVNAASPVKALSSREVVALYTGRTRSFPDGSPAVVYDLPRDSPARAALYLGLTGMSLAQVNSYWSRVTFTGQTLPPQPVPGEAAMAAALRQIPDAIGYLTEEPTDKALRVVFVLRTGGSPG